MTSGPAHETRHQVFVSSTYTDLVEERRAVIQALLELDCIPAGMEMFPAANDDQWTLIREVIGLSDYYIVIVGGRYGSVTEEGISYTEKEYDYAVECGIPVLGFTHGDPSAIPFGLSEIDESAREKLEAFRTKVRQRMVKDYSGPDDLASVVSRGLIRTIRQNPRPGWVRGDRAMTEATRTEIAELRAALAEAEREQAQRVIREGAAEIDSTFAHGSDEITLRFEAAHGGPFAQSKQDVELDLTWDDIVSSMGPVMLDEASETALRRALGDLAVRALVATDNGWEELAMLSASVTDESWGLVIVQLRALGLVDTGTKRRTVSDRSVYWRLTPAGDDYVVRLTAIKRDVDGAESSQPNEP